MTAIPRAALILGCAGLLPFLWGALLNLGIFTELSTRLPAVLGGDGRLIMIRYGGIILPFMAGVLWGFATKAQGSQAAVAYALSVIPALWWFFMPGTGATSALANLITGYVGLLLLDFAFARWGLAPPWWMALRCLLTSVVVVCLCTGIFL